MEPITRREAFIGSAAMASATALGLPFVELTAAAVPPADKKLKVVVSSGHPDDPESGCGGTMARYADLGHEVVALYLTRGEAGIGGKSHEQAAAIRTAEAKRACEILGARSLFAGQIDGSAEISPKRYEQFSKVLAAEKPDLVFTHWPIDTHRDHRAASLLTYDAWLAADKSFDLYYFEVNAGGQTQHFWPTNFVDITETEARKRAACYAHESQSPATGLYPEYHDPMNRFRGLQAGCRYAEAFVRHVRSAVGPPPSVG